jgi:tetratricopeptide (TPR) repeat protein/transcriptional regulator with XRE-family HTH domain
MEAGRVSAFGDQLRRHRQAAGLTQEELAADAGLSVRAIADMERGRTARPYRRSVALLTEALELSAADAARFRRSSRTSASSEGSAGGQGPTAEVQLLAATAHVAPRQLPAALGHFVGRAAELARLNTLLGDATSRHRTAVISAIGGSAGVGKTALAVHWGHQVADQFPDGQLYVNLRGFDPSGIPLSPAAAIRGFLDALRVPPAEIPVGLDAQAGLYRSLMADRAMLLLLDNARDAEQVRPLLPASSRCVVLVTSRSPLTGLVAGAGASPLLLDVFTSAEAAALLADRLGTERIAREKVAAGDVVRACARLPLAVAIAAARAAGRPGVPLGELAAELRDSRHLLDSLDTSDPATSPRSVFSWSYQLLHPSAARLFRLLAQHPGPDTSAPAAASLADVPPGQALKLLDELCEANLLATPHPGRFSLHDLLRAYANERASDEERAADRDAATRRVLTWYLHTAAAAARTIDPSRRHVDLDSSALPGEPMIFAGHDDALEWLESERANLLAAVACASQRQVHEIAWQLPVTLWDLFDRRSLWADWIEAVETGLASAQRLGDLAAQSWLLNHLAIAHQQAGDSPMAISCFERALLIRREQQDLRGEATVLANLGRTYSEAGMQTEAMMCLPAALAIFRDIGKVREQGICWSLISATNRRLGQFDDAVTSARLAADLISESGDELEECGALLQLAMAEICLARPGDAIAQAARAVELSRQHGDRRTEADALIILAQACSDCGHSGQAGQCRHDAYLILRDLGDPRAATLADQLGDVHGRRATLARGLAYLRAGDVYPACRPRKR